MLKHLRLPPLLAAWHISRLAADWRDRVAAGINELTHLAEQQALDEPAALEQLIIHSSSKAPELEQAIGELEQFQSGLRVEQQAGAALQGDARSGHLLP